MIMDLNLVFRCLFEPLSAGEWISHLFRGGSDLGPLAALFLDIVFLLLTALLAWFLDYSSSLPRHRQAFYEDDPVYAKPLLKDSIRHSHVIFIVAAVYPLVVLGGLLDLLQLRCLEVVKEVGKRKVSSRGGGSATGTLHRGPSAGAREDSRGSTGSRDSGVDLMRSTRSQVASGGLVFVPIVQIVVGALRLRGRPSATGALRQRQQDALSRRTVALYQSGYWYFLAIAIVSCVGGLLKRYVGRPRPCFYAGCGYETGPDDVPEDGSGSSSRATILADLSKCRRPGVAVEHMLASFPSGHTYTIAVAMVYVALELGSSSSTLCSSFPRLFLSLGCFAAIAAVGASRIHDGKHFVSDVLSGAALGICFARIFHRTMLGAVREVARGAFEKEGPRLRGFTSRTSESGEEFRELVSHD